MSILCDAVRIRLGPTGWKTVCGLRLSDTLALSQQPGSMCRITHLPSGLCLPLLGRPATAADDLAAVVRKYLIDLPWPTNPRLRRFIKSDPFRSAILAAAHELGIHDERYAVLREGVTP